MLASYAAGAWYIAPDEGTVIGATPPPGDEHDPAGHRERVRKCGPTAGFSLIAATTAPGRTTHSATAPTQPDPTSGAQSQAPSAMNPASSNRLRGAFTGTAEWIRRVPSRYLRRLLTNARNPSTTDVTYSVSSVASREPSRLPPLRIARVRGVDRPSAIAA